jgi:hypothetical protein
VHVVNSSIVDAVVLMTHFAVVLALCIICWCRQFVHIVITSIFDASVQSTHLSLVVSIAVLRLCIVKCYERVLMCSVQPTPLTGLVPIADFSPVFASYSPRMMRAFVFSCALLNISSAASVSNVKGWLSIYLLAPSTMYKDKLDQLLAETSGDVLTAVAKSMKLGCSVQQHVQKQRMLNN